MTILALLAVVGATEAVVYQARYRASIGGPRGPLPGEKWEPMVRACPNCKAIRKHGSGPTCQHCGAVIVKTSGGVK